ncbi:hypothetical protein ACFFMR_10825 [Micromonospora andamanensis]|uniref:Lipoprotein n=1 Tax=Micromonospora andamanensis TaxID=1287068 RepID=A0ABQ4HPA3_9ACTN|nr:hypothetical protein [Micromonospora andamanensis]GIJ07481.1 hypothetical protein Van01_06950 [Micromonospora andamanensis]GIJ36765.1 hypothetical protein Vwe01_00900 [Micromonospora andamanensis]
MHGHSPGAAAPLPPSSTARWRGMALLILLGVPALVVALCCGVVHVVTRSATDDPFSHRGGVTGPP